MTVEELIKTALIELSVYEPGDAIPPEDIELGVTRLQLMLDAWTIEGLLVPAQLMVGSGPVTVPASEYTIGIAGVEADLTAEITELHQVNYKRVANTRAHPLQKSNHVWLSEVNDPTSAFGPDFYFFQPNEPIAKLQFNAPTQVGDSFTLYYDGYLIPSGVEADAELLLPRGYHKAVMLNLAKDLGPAYGKSLSRGSATEALAGKSQIKTHNIQPVGARLDPSMPGLRGSNYLYGRR